MIVVPKDFHSRYTAKQREVVLQHEMAHRDRRDPLINLVALLINTVFWFNPLVHWAVRALKCDQEIACDAVVLSATNISRKSYAKTLLAAVVHEASPPVSCAWHSGSRLTHRFDALDRRCLFGQTASMGSIAGLLVLSSCGFANLQNGFSFSSLPDPAEQMDEVLALADRHDQPKLEHHRMTNASAVQIKQFGGLLRIVSEDREDALLSVSSNRSSVSSEGGVLHLVGQHSPTADECNSLALGRLNSDDGIDVATLRIPHGLPVEIGGYVYTVASDSDQLHLSLRGCGVAQIESVRGNLTINGRGQHRIATQGVGGDLVAALRGQTEMSTPRVFGKTDARLRGQAKLAIRESDGSMTIETLGQSLVRVDRATASVGVSERERGQVRVGT
ncbi:MAG: M56 family metallopeptidase, partial [Pseudomonadota bacterium]